MAAALVSDAAWALCHWQAAGKRCLLPPLAGFSANSAVEWRRRCGQARGFVSERLAQQSQLGLATSARPESAHAHADPPRRIGGLPLPPALHESPRLIVASAVPYDEPAGEQIR